MKATAMREKNLTAIERTTADTFRALETMLDQQAEEIRRLIEQNNRLHADRLELIKMWTARLRGGSED
jgi:hypothetical protein